MRADVMTFNGNYIKPVERRNPEAINFAKHELGYLVDNYQVPKGLETYDDTGFLNLSLRLDALLVHSPFCGYSTLNTPVKNSYGDVFKEGHIRHNQEYPLFYIARRDPTTISLVTQTDVSDVKATIDEVFGMGGYSYEDGSLIQVGVVENKMYPMYRATRGKPSEWELLKKVWKITTRKEFLKAFAKELLPSKLKPKDLSEEVLDHYHNQYLDKTRKLGYLATIGPGFKILVPGEHDLGRVSWTTGYQTEGPRSEETDPDKYQIGIRLFVDNDSASLVLDSVDKDGRPGNPVILPISTRYDTIESVWGLNVKHFLQHLPEYLLEGIKKLEHEGVDIDPACKSELEDIVNGKKTLPESELRKLIS